MPRAKKPEKKESDQSSSSSSSSSSDDASMDSQHPVPAFPNGEIFCDRNKTRWRLGELIGAGGFGSIYLASKNISKPVKSNEKYVIKVEPLWSKSSFIERDFYSTVATAEKINKWKEERNMASLGMPHHFGAGYHDYEEQEYLFLVIPRLGADLSKSFLECGNKFHIKTAFTLAVYVMDILEYIHSNNYVQRDIKLENLLLGLKGSKAPVYLVDFGLVYEYRLPNGKHKNYNEDEGVAQYGTLRFNSRDSHLGALSRRGDMEMLGYNIIHWLTGHLPWEDDEEDYDVGQKKRYYMMHIAEFLERCFKPAQPPAALQDYLKYVNELKFEGEPNYEYCRNLFRSGIRHDGFCDDGKLTFKSHAKLNQKKRKNLATENVEVKQSKRSRPAQPKRVLRSQTRKDKMNRSESDVPSEPKAKPDRRVAESKKPRKGAKKATKTAESQTPRVDLLSESDVDSEPKAKPDRKVAEPKKPRKGTKKATKTAESQTPRVDLLSESDVASEPKAKPDRKVAESKKPRKGAKKATKTAESQTPRVENTEAGNVEKRCLRSNIKKNA